MLCERHESSPDHVGAAEHAVHACLPYQGESILHTQHNAQDTGLRAGDEIPMETAF